MRFSSFTGTLAQNPRFLQCTITSPIAPTITSTATQAIAITRRGRHTHVISKHKKVRIWHRRLGHARVICAAKLTTGMGNFNEEYDPTEIYSDSNASESEPEDETITMPPAESFEEMGIGPGLIPDQAMEVLEEDFERVCRHV